MDPKSGLPQSDKNHHCFRCGNQVVDARISRNDSCIKCGADLKVCRNCVHFDAGAYNECREPQAERVVDKERSNFCDYFSFRSGGGTSVDGSSGASAQEIARKKLEDLFK